jgi:hypothetical protein
MSLSLYARHDSTPSRTLSRCTAALLAASVATGTLLAQVPQASYPLLTDLNDATGLNGPVMLIGTAPPPANGVCLNGTYSFGNPNGQDIRTPVLSTLDTNDFQLEVEFQVAALPGFNSPIVIGGNGWRWIGFLVQPNGTLGILHNNAMQEWSSTTIALGTWYDGMIKYEAGIVELHLDGVMIHQANIGPLNTGNNHNFVTNNYSNATAFNGCVRNLLISNDTTLGMSGGSLGTNYCSPGVPNSTGASGVMSAMGSAVALDNDVTLEAASLPNNAFAYFITSQTQGLVPNPGGSTGTLCLGGSIGRYVGQGQILNTGGTGAVSLVLNLAQTPQPTGFVSIAAGETWNFQCWHRDAVGGTATSNFTDGYSILFQ